MDSNAGYFDSPILAELYDLVPGYISRPDKDFYLRTTASISGNIIELGCGTGRILVPIAEAGHSITGVDASAHMLARCRQKLDALSENKKGRVQLIKGDMAHLTLDESFDLAIIPFRAFQHLMTIDDQMSCLQTLNRSLTASGRLVFDVFHVDFNRINNPAHSEEMVDMPEFELPGGRRLKRAGRMAGFHPAKQYNDVEMIYYLTDVNGKTKRIVHGFPYRYFFRYEMEHLLERCGFRIIALYGNFDESPLTGSSPEMIFIAEKYKEI